jgi:hypothetical protein
LLRPYLFVNRYFSLLTRRSLSQKGQGTFCIFDIGGNPHARDDTPQINIDDQTGFTKGTMVRLGMV